MLLLLQRWYLDRENKKRDREPPDMTYDDVWIKVTDEDGQIVEKKVDKVSPSLKRIYDRVWVILITTTYRPFWIWLTVKTVTSVMCFDVDRTKLKSFGSDFAFMLMSYQLSMYICMYNEWNVSIRLPYHRLGFVLLHVVCPTKVWWCSMSESVYWRILPALWSFGVRRIV